MFRASSIRLPFAAALAAALAACASGGPRPPDQNPALVAAVRATPRVVAGESTWVTSGPGYDIVAFSRRDIADVDSSVAQQSRVYTELFGSPPAKVVVSVHRIAAPTLLSAAGMAFASGPPLPAGSMEPVVDIPLFAPSAREHDTPTDRVMRAWLSARATTLTGHPPAQGSTGLVNDPRVPDWAEAMLPALVAPGATVDRMVAALSAANVRVYPLDEFFSMQPPVPLMAGLEGGPDTAAGRRGAAGRAGRGDEGGGERGGGGEGGGEGGGYGGGGVRRRVRRRIRWWVRRA